MSWRTQRRAEFQHCDAHGIVFFPRYLEMVDSVIEQYFREHVGYDFHKMHVVDHRGVPTALLNIEFHAPSYLEDLLDFDLSVERAGKASVTIRIVISSGDETRVSLTTTRVQADMTTRRSTPWHDHVREKLNAT
ncbi:MAG: acyl-CoA thioesterase [Rhodobacteraceae bacterium]|nr:acyl-CoA thioesterase [Paracoccaceae bacterium]